MKKILIITLLMAFSLSFPNTFTVQASSSEYCHTAPELYDFSISPDTLDENEPFTVHMTWLDECNHVITAVKINGVIYDQSDFTKAYILENQMPLMKDGYYVELELIYSSQMGDHIELQAFEHSDFTDGWLNIHYGVVYTSETISNIFETEQINLGVDPSVYVRFTGDEYVIYNEETDDLLFYDNSNNLLLTVNVANLLFGNTNLLPDGSTYDLEFLSSLYVNGVGDLADFVMSPMPNKAYYVMTYTYESLKNISLSDSFTDFAYNTAYDIILANDSVSDILLNKATYNVIESIQAENPDYIFPSGYMWIDGVFTGVLLDEDGNYMLDSDGNIAIDENADTYDPDSSYTPPSEGLLSFIESVFDLLNVSVNPFNTASKIQAIWNFVSNYWLLIIIGVFLVLTIGIWLPYLPLIFTVLKTFFGNLIYLAVTILGLFFKPFTSVLSRLSTRRL